MRKLHFLTAVALAATPVLAQDATTPAGDTMAAGGNALVGLLITLIIGAIVGWIASVIMKGGGSGIVMDIILGIGGALIAGWLFPMIGVSFGAGLIPCGLLLSGEQRGQDESGQENRDPDCRLCARHERVSKRVEDPEPAGRRCGLGIKERRLSDLLADATQATITQTARSPSSGRRPPRT